MLSGLRPWHPVQSGGGGLRVRGVVIRTGRREDLYVAGGTLGHKGENHDASPTGGLHGRGTVRVAVGRDRRLGGPAFVRPTSGVRAAARGRWAHRSSRSLGTSCRGPGRSYAEPRAADRRDDGGCAATSRDWVDRRNSGGARGATRGCDGRRRSVRVGP